jgi:hypothetical protein
MIDSKSIDDKNNADYIVKVIDWYCLIEINIKGGALVILIKVGI